MPIPNSIAISWKPRSLSDSADGTTAFDGAMKSLVNLIPDDATDRVFSCRPAAVKHVDLDAGFISGLLTVGNIAYGMIDSASFAGRDEPFAINLETGVPLPVSGATSANTPLSATTSGAWTPPVLAQVASRVIVTHPGFSGANLFSQTTAGNTGASPTITGNPDILGVLPGMGVAGTGIPAGTEVVSTAYFQLITTGDTHTSTTLDALADTSGVAVGQLVFGDNIAAGTTVAAVVGATEVTLSLAATGTTAGGRVVFAGATITLSKASTATADGVTLTISGIPRLFGWFDVSGYNQTTVGVTSSGSRVIRGNPAILGVECGMTIAGTGIPVGATVVGADFFTKTTAGTTTLGGVSVTGMPDTGGIFIGQQVFGGGIPPGTFVAGGGGGNSFVTLSKQATAAGTVALTFVGATITMSAAATATGSQVNLTIAGGTTAAPQWGSGNTYPFQLPSIPVSVVQFNGRAYYACMTDGVLFSDVGLPCRISNSLGVQALLMEDGLAVTALSPLMLEAPLTGGIVQAVIIFESIFKMRQITGDPTTNNLAMNLLNVATGTLAPNSICSSEYGVFFMSPHGLRLIDKNAKVSAPIGDHGLGVSVPFLEVSEPSRIAAAANADVLRISVETASAGVVEYWYDLTRQVWTGPHNFPASLIEPWANTFIMTPVGVGSSLWRSDVTQTPTSIYVENDVVMMFEMETVLLPDNGGVSMNAMVEANLACSMPSTERIAVRAFDEDGVILDTIQVGPSAPGITPRLRQRPMYWTETVVFKQASIRMFGFANADLRIGDLYMRWRPLGYSATPPFVNYLYSDDTPPRLLTDDHGEPLVSG